MDPGELVDAPLEELCAEARRLRTEGHGTRITFSPKVFIPLTKLCRDVCHYCTFARPPRRGERAYLDLDEVLEIARAGAATGCHEALFTLGDKPELRYRVAREELAGLGCETTLEYLAVAAEAVLWTASAARILLGPEASVQCPPNLSYDDFPRLLEAGIDDWGGISPVTVDHVNPEAPWPEVERLERATQAAGLELAPRLAVYPRYVAGLGRWVDPAV